MANVNDIEEEVSEMGDDRPPIIPLIIIGPDGKPAPVPPSKPPGE